MVEIQYTVCHWATNRSDPQNLLSITLDVPLQLLENFLQKCSMEYTLYPWISLLEPTLEISYKSQT